MLVERTFYRKFLDLRETLQLALSMRGTEVRLLNSMHKNVTLSQLYGEDNITYSIYYKELLRLPVSYGSFEFMKVS